MTKSVNRVDYYLKDKRLLSTDIVHWDQYITALRASDTVTISKTEYLVNKINMVHDSANLVLKVSVEPFTMNI
ncbi:hypothetical protein M3181_02410 [Mesobacillus maritimus]|uniref:hypothetical protein n=1 Tax=Mesobacillus maritimus TaxID=1643336 RepID=UPI00204082E2|nr:hypothetical protein [Mesobacillus maritimus]MCM3667854.1 hypothetical protein [Mesobacillus maritimus]